jgi:hypothetical protein
MFFLILVCEPIGTAATPDLQCQSRVIVKMIVEKPMECRLARETEVLGENLPQRHFCPSQNPPWPDPGLNPGCRIGKPATNGLSFGVAWHNIRTTLLQKLTLCKERERDPSSVPRNLGTSVRHSLAPSFHSDMLCCNSWICLRQSVKWSLRWVSLSSLWRVACYKIWKRGNTSVCLLRVTFICL